MIHIPHVQIAYRNLTKKYLGFDKLKLEAEWGVFMAFLGVGQCPLMGMCV